MGVIVGVRILCSTVQCRCRWPGTSRSCLRSAVTVGIECSMFDAGIRWQTGWSLQFCSDHDDSSGEELARRRCKLSGAFHEPTTTLQAAGTGTGDSSHSRESERPGREVDPVHVEKKGHGQDFWKNGRGRAGILEGKQEAATRQPERGSCQLLFLAFPFFSFRL